MGIENIDLFPFVLSLSKHERGFAGQAQKSLFGLKTRNPRLETAMQAAAKEMKD